MTNTSSENDQIDYDAVETQFSDSKKAELDPSVYHETERHFDGSVEANRKEYGQVLSDNSPELVKKLEMEAQYGERLNTLKHYGFLDESGEAKEGDIKAPTYEEAMATFKPEELEIAGNFQKLTLFLIPETSFEAKVKAMDAHKQGMQENDTYVNKIYTDSDSGSEKITGWRAVIVDGAQEMEAYEGDKLDLRFDKRIEARKATRKEGEKGMDRHRYALLMMEAIRNGNPVDKNLYTLLDDDPALSDSGVPDASFFAVRRGVDFAASDPDFVDGNARFRSSVGGGVLLS